MTNVPILDLVVAALLAATCGWCVLLVQKLKALKAGQTELQSAIAEFDAATRRAERNLDRMEEAGVGIGRDLDAMVARGGGLLTDLSVMVSAGDTIALRLEEAIGEVRVLGARKAGGRG